MVVASVGAANRKGDVAGSARTPRTSVQIDCWSAALSERMPAVANAQAHEVAVAWHARKDPKPRDGVPVVPDIQNQAGFVVCRRLGCC